METCDFKWTGFYFGGNLGYARGDEDTELRLSGEFLNGDTPQETIDSIEHTGGRGLDADAFVAGGFFGYNYQLSHVVFGLETGMSWLNLRDSSNLHVEDTNENVRTS